MNNSNKGDFAALLDSVMPVYRIEASTATKQLWWNLLVNYELPDVAQAFAEHMRKNKFPPTPADIITIIDKLHPDGRLGADEAWAMIPRGEHASVVMTDEMAEALRFAQPLLDEGDQVAARMAFKEAYTHLVDENRMAGIPPRWFPSLGTNATGRDMAIAEAIAKGRIGVGQAKVLLSPEKAAFEKLPALPDGISEEKRLENIVRLHEAIGNFRKTKEISNE